MFVPSESVYAELHDGFDDLIQKAYRAQVVLVSPSLLMLAIQVMQQIQKDARMREAAHEIRTEVGHLMKDLEQAARTRAEPAETFRSGQRGRGADPHLGRQGGQARRAHRTLEFADACGGPQRDPRPARPQSHSGRMALVKLAIYRMALILHLQLSFFDSRRDFAGAKGLNVDFQSGLICSRLRWCSARRIARENTRRGCSARSVALVERVVALAERRAIRSASSRTSTRASDIPPASTPASRTCAPAPCGSRRPSRRTTATTPSIRCR